MARVVLKVKLEKISYRPHASSPECNKMKNAFQERPFPYAALVTAAAVFSVRYGGEYLNIVYMHLWS
jgi:hypothetical protein